MEISSIYSQNLLEAVVPFDVLLDRRKRTKFLNSLKKGLETQRSPKVVRDAGIALASLVDCEEALERELIVSNSYVFLLITVLHIVSELNLVVFIYHPFLLHLMRLVWWQYNFSFIILLFCAYSYVPGMEVTLSSRLKSLHSIYSKVLISNVVFQSIIGCMTVSKLF